LMFTDVPLLGRIDDSGYDTPPPGCLLDGLYGSGKRPDETVHGGTVQPVVRPTSPLLAFHQADVGQLLQMMGQGGLADAKGRRQVAGAHGRVRRGRDVMQQPQTYRIGHRLQQGRQANRFSLVEQDQAGRAATGPRRFRDHGPSLVRRTRTHPWVSGIGCETWNG